MPDPFTLHKLAEQFQTMRVLPSMRAWHKRNVLDPVERLWRRDYLCPECRDQYREMGGCEVCENRGYVGFGTLQECDPVRAQRLIEKALR